MRFCLSKGRRVLAFLKALGLLRLRLSKGSNGLVYLKVFGLLSFTFSKNSSLSPFYILLRFRLSNDSRVLAFLKASPASLRCVLEQDTFILA